jgi:hypothetical protein
MKLKLPKILQWRVRIAQSGYDLGYKQGFEAGKIEKHGEIVQMLSYKLENIDWLREEPIQVREIVPMVKQHKTETRDVWE